MANRREFLQGTIAVSALPLLSSATLAEFATPAGAHALYKAVFDERSSASRAFANEMRARGIAVHAIKGDITQLWYDDLHARWTKDQSVVAGVTEAQALFCLERLSWDYQMRVVYRSEHTATSNEIKIASIADSIASVPRTAPGVAVPLASLRPNSLYAWVIAPVKRTSFIA